MQLLTALILLTLAIPNAQQPQDRAWMEMAARAI
jgi:hypothetical protein